MKHLICLTYLLFLCVSASAQEKFVEGNMIVYGKTFEVIFLKDFDAIVVDSSLPMVTQSRKGRLRRLRYVKVI